MIRFVGIDPSTHTGFVAIDLNGKTLVAKELTGSGDVDPRRITTLTDEVRDHLKKTDVVYIEGFSYRSKGRGVSFQYALGWLIRVLLYRSGMKYKEIAPTALKSRVGVTGFKGEKGKKVRLEKEEKKQAVITGTDRTFGRSFTNDNINDAYILAQMARENYLKGGGKSEAVQAVIQGSNDW